MTLRTTLHQTRVFRTCAIGAFAVLFAGTVRTTAEPVLFHAQGGPVKTLWGDGFGPEAVALGATIEADDKAIVSAISQTPYDRSKFLPDAPPDNARGQQRLARDPQGRVLAVRTGARGSWGNADWTASPDLIWVRDGEAVSQPLLPTAAQPWWLFPDRAEPGQTIAVHGRNLARGRIALKRDGSGEPLLLEPLRGGTYSQQWQVPFDLEPGRYSFYFHNGRGGEAGWAGPLSLTVTAPPEAERPVVEAADFGARGIGTGDDTAALRAAMEAATGQGAIVVLGPGNFPVSGTLRVPDGVLLRGAGPGATTLQVHRENPFEDGFPADADIRGYASDWFPHMDSNGYVGRDGYGPMVWLQNASGVEGMTLLPAHRSGIGILVAREGAEPAKDVTIERVNIELYHQPAGWVTPYFIAVLGRTEYLVIRDCNMVGAGGVGLHSTGHRQVHIARNRITGIPQGSRNLLFLRSLSESVIEHNHLRDGDRNIVYQSGERMGKDEVPEGRRNSSLSSTHNLYYSNIFENNIPRDHNSGEIMFEVNDIFWGGNGTEFSTDGFRVEDGPFNADLVGNHVMVIDGRGTGQYRRIAANDDEHITLNRPWDVVPDGDSYLKVGAAAVQCLWIANTEYNIANWTGLWGNNIANVVDGHIQHGGSGLYLWSPGSPANSPNPRPTMFNDFINNRLVDRGNIVLQGRFVLGNTVRANQITGFRFRPNYHSVKGWMSNPETFRVGDHPGIELSIDRWSDQRDPWPGLRSTDNFIAWNIIERNHLYEGGRGIVVEPGVRHTIILDNAIEVDGEAMVVEEESLARP